MYITKNSGEKVEKPKKNDKVVATWIKARKIDKQLMKGVTLPARQANKLMKRYVQLIREIRIMLEKQSIS